MKYLTAKLIGAAVGGTIGYFVGSVIVEIIRLKYYNPDDYEYEDLDEDPGNDDDTNLEEEPVLMGRKEKEVKNRRGKVKSYTEFFKQEGKPDLAALVAKYNDGVLETEEPSTGIDPDYMIEDELEQDVPTDIMVISKAEFASNTDYEVHTFKYYQGDDVVTSDNDIPIPHPEDILGDEALVSFGIQSEDPDIVYIRNDKKNALYEIVRTEKSFGAPAPMRRIRRNTSPKEEENAEEDHTA